MSLDNESYICGPPGNVISISVSKFGVIYVGWSDGSVLRLPLGQNALECYVQGADAAIHKLEHRTPRSQFSFVNPLALDAWGSELSQYIGDAYYNRIFEVKGETIEIVAGTGERGSSDGDALTEASFKSIRGISVLSYRTVILTAKSIRFINRRTSRVTTLQQHINGLDTAFLLPTAHHSFLVTCPTFTAHHRWLSHEISSWNVNTTHISNPSKAVPIFRHGNTVIRGSLHSNDSSIIVISCTFEGRQETINLPRLEWLAAPLYCPLSDSLITIAGKKLHIFKNFLGVKKERLIKEFKFSIAESLSGPNGLLTDLEICHEASQTSFGVHRSLIDRSMFALEGETPSDRLATFIRSSTLSIEIIHHFIEYLYFAPPPRDPTLLIAFCWMYKAAFGRENFSTLKLLRKRIDAMYSSEVSELLISTWMNQFTDYFMEESSLIVALLVAGARRDQSNFQMIFNDEMLSMSSSDDRKRHIHRLSALLPLVYRPYHVLQLPKTPKPLCYQFHPVALASISDFLSCYSTNFATELTSYDTIGVCGWLLYAHWPWFKRLVESGLQESKTRIVTLPSDSLTADAWRTVICTVQFGYTASLNHLEKDDALSVLVNARAYDLFDSNGKALPRIHPLIESCEKEVFPTLSAQNCWSQLKFARSLQSSKYDLILATLPTVVQGIDFDVLEDMPDEMASDLARALKSKKKPAKAVRKD